MSIGVRADMPVVAMTSLYQRVLPALFLAPPQSGWRSVAVLLIGHAPRAELPVTAHIAPAHAIPLA
ncbi:MAG: hypothetical protein V4754_18950 [Pseudomonadota bacterium]